jgi:RNA polymerase sigma factor (sigma-70 family)
MKVRPLRPLAPGGPRTDADALRSVAAGDIGALGEIYDRHARALTAFVARIYDATEAEDVVQAVFLRAWHAAPTYDGRNPNAQSWLFGIAIRLVLERRRSFRRLSRALLRAVIGPDSTPREAEPRRLDLERGLKRLSPEKRDVLLLAEVEGFSCEEIAGILGIPVGTVWTRLHYARRTLRRYFGEGR